jgi:competence protein ComEA
MMKKLLVLLAFCSANVFASPVNINTADAKTIADSLSGIGIKKAEVIVDYRTKKGDFKSIDDLSHVSGIGAKTIEKNKADILLNDTSAPTLPDSSKQTPPPTSETVTKPVEKKK